MRRAFEVFTHHVLRSRVGLAALLAIVVLAIVGSAKLLGDGVDDSGALSPPPTSAPITGDPRAGDDGIDSPEPAVTPTMSPGTAEPIAVARAFALAWLDHNGVSQRDWYGGLLPHSTPRVARLLEGVDPSEVPADRVTGEPIVIPRSPEFIEVEIPVDSGRLRLQLIAPEGRWLVDGIDWERA